MNNSILPTGPLADVVFSALEPLPEPLRNHCLRTFVFAELIADETEPGGCDRRLLFAATAMHDLGLGPGAEGRQRFEVEGADLAVSRLIAHGFDEQQADEVWEAIALHTSGGIAERRGPLARLTRAGVLADLGRHPLISAERAAAVHDQFPRLNAVRSIVDAAVAHAERSPSAGAAYTLAGELTRERRDGGTTRLEAGATHAPWCD
ncbi:HD domain-containing protein [Microbacterium kyungheense]|uniref:HD superfamily phosphohydrolase YqeK n=1 Tax=Microbacterium kyungheense TaxID=1263636 RepID=A0A543EU39_9MICO|nr:HD domain-containing protein [Microbacterium kyungheense]TQM25093.1 HD superfamily phosphohydrolase YqeK [Microbacterium kyungheense]